jgi:CBS domain-containing protein
MLANRKPLTALTAADVMSRELVVIPEHMSLRSAARLLSQSRVSGAPVIDSAGRCVGVLSATDFVRWAREAGHQYDRRPGAECVCADWQVIEPGTLPADSVAAHMTHGPITAPTTATVRELARRMLEAHIHRVVIVDGDNDPVGIVSSTDILSVLTQTMEGEQ